MHPDPRPHPPGQRPRRRSPRAAAAAAALALAAALSGCGATAGGSGAAVTVWHGYNDAESDALTSLAAEWNAAHPDQQVELVFDGGNDGALQKTVTGGITRSLPEVAYEYGSSVATLARQPRVQDLTDTVAAPGWDWQDFYPATRQAATTGGRVIGVPALVDDLALVYDKKAFADAGVPEPTDQWSWEQFRDAARRLSGDGPQGRTYGWAYVDDGSEDTTWRYLAMLWQAGGELLTPDGTRAAFDGPAGLAALQQLRDMAVTDGSVYLDAGTSDYLNLFNSGRVAMLWTGPWDLGSINDDVDYGVTFLPGYQGNHESISGPDVYVTFAPADQALPAAPPEPSGGSGAAAPAAPAAQPTSASSATALAFLQWLTSPSVHLRFCQATGDLPLRASETRLPEYAQYTATYPGDEVFVANLDNVRHARPNIPAYGQVSAVIGQMVQSVLIGQAQPADALATASAQVDSVLEQDR